MRNSRSDFSTKNHACGKPVALQRAVDIWDQMNESCGTLLEGMTCLNRF
jgi:hypothetical protein